MAQANQPDDELLRRLEGRSCDYCEEGKLERDTYKEDDAVVCESCGAPVARIWNEIV